MEENTKSKQLILIADDSEMNRSILTDMLGEEFDTIEAADGVEAIEQIEKYDDKISLVLLDIVMPRLDGFGVLAKMNERQWIQDIPVIIISSENASAFVERGYELGATDYIGCAPPFVKYHNVIRQAKGVKGHHRGTDIQARKRAVLND